MPNTGQGQGSLGKCSVAIFGPKYLTVSWGIRSIDDDSQPSILSAVIEVCSRDHLGGDRGKDTLPSGDQVKPEYSRS